MSLNIIYLVQVRLRTEVLCTPSSTRPGFEILTPRSWQYLSCHWGACSNHAIWFPFIILKHPPQFIPIECETYIPLVNVLGLKLYHEDMMLKPTLSDPFSADNIWFSCLCVSMLIFCIYYIWLMGLQHPSDDHIYNLLCWPLMAFNIQCLM